MAGQPGEASLVDDGPAGRLRDDEPSLPAIWQKLSSGSAAIQAAERGLHEAQFALLDMRTDLQERTISRLVRHPGTLASYAGRLQDAAASAGENGVNLLIIDQGEEAVAALGAALTRGPEGGLALRSVDVDRSRTALFDRGQSRGARRGIIDRALDGSAFAACPNATGLRTEETDVLERLEAALAEVKTALSLLSIARSRVGLQASFLAALFRDLAAPIPSAVAEPLDEDALRRTALQTQQLLSEQTRSIACLNQQTVLKLFQPA